MRQLKITKSITNRESASLDKYLQEIGREDLITVEEEVELAGRIRNGDRAALEKLTRSNLRFVVSVAKQYQNQGLSLPDLINEGNLGLIKAAEKFDETRGFKFISYAVWWIRQSILQALAEQSRIVRLPLNQVGSLNKINKAFQRFEQEFERKPSAEELAEILDIPVDKIADTLKMSGRHISVDAPFVEGEDNSLIDVMVNVTRRNISNTRHRHTIHDVQRIVRLRQRRTTTDTNLNICIWATLSRRNRHTGQLTLQCLRCGCYRNVLQLLCTHRSHRSHHVTFLGRTITGYHHFLKSRLVLLKRYIDDITIDCHLLGLQTNVGKNQHLSVCRYVNRVLTVKIGYRTNTGALNHYRSLNYSLSCVISNYAGNNARLYAHTREQKAHHCYQTKCTEMYFHKIILIS